MPLLLGCIADDFTGATDLANTLVKGGMTAVQVIGVPTGPLPEADAIIIALKSRTAPVGEAVAQSLAACDALLAAGAKQIFWKYCSTFDSTDQGNIGPVADALLKRLGSGFALACPAFPTNGRTIYRLRVDGMAGEADATSFCAALQAEGTECVPVAQR